MDNLVLTTDSEIFRWTSVFNKERNISESVVRAGLSTFHHLSNSPESTVSPSYVSSHTEELW